MKKTTAISCAFLDIGGVLLTDGRDYLARKQGIVQFLVSFIHASRPQRSSAIHPALESSD
jgi:hypothetical protein